MELRGRVALLHHPMRVVAAAVALLAALTPLGPLGTERASAAHVRPNVLVIITDDQRATALRRDMPETHRWLARQGTRYAEAYTAVPNCCPSRASVFTGQYAHNHGVLNNQQGYKIPQEATIQYRLKQAGYRTGLFGKYLNGWALATPPPYFDDFAFFNGGYYNARWNDNGTIRTLPRYSTRVVQRRGVRFIETAEGSDADPWFLYLAPFSPHVPYTAEPRYRSAAVSPWYGNPAVFEDDLGDKPPVVRDRERFEFERGRDVQTRQARMLYTVDDLVAQVRAALEDNNEARDTMVVFTSDNGMMWGEHGLGGPTYGKRFPYTPSIKIPLYVRWRGHLEGGTTHREVVSNVDIAPTIMEAAGLPDDPNYPMDGRSLLHPTADRVVLIEYFRDVIGSEVPPWASLRDLETQYIEYYEDDGATVSFREYYDLLADPWQLSNLLSDPDPLNDPDTGSHERRLAEAKGCRGTDCP